MNLHGIGLRTGGINPLVQSQEGDLFFIRGTLTTTGGAPLIQALDSAQIFAGNHLVNVDEGTLNVSGQLLHTPSGTPTINIGNDVLHVASSFTGPTGVFGLIEMRGGTLFASGDILEIGDPTSTFNLDVPLVFMSGCCAPTPNTTVLQAANGLVLPPAMVSSLNSSVLFNLNGAVNLSTTGSLVLLPGTTANSISLSLPTGGVLNAFSDGELGPGNISSGSDLIDIDFAELTVNGPEALVKLRGTVTLTTTGGSDLVEVKRVHVFHSLAQHWTSPYPLIRSRSLRRSPNGRHCGERAT